MDTIEHTDLLPGILAALVMTIMGIAVGMNGNEPQSTDPTHDSPAVEDAAARSVSAPTRPQRPQNVNGGNTVESATGNIKTKAAGSRYNLAGLPA